METSTARAIHDPAADFYMDALKKLLDTGIPFLVGGAFAIVGGQSRSRIARLDPSTGFADSFNPNAVSGDVYTMTLQADGKILVGGGFTSIGGQTRHGIARRLPNG